MDIKADKMRYVNYQCQQCGAEDTGKYFMVDDPITSPINCWSCHAGWGVSQQKMLETQTGMFALAPVVS